MRLLRLHTFLVMVLSALLMASTLAGCCGGGDDAKTVNVESSEGSSKNKKKDKKKKDKKKKDKKKKEKESSDKGAGKWKDEAASFSEDKEGLRKFMKACLTAQQKGKAEKLQTFTSTLAVPDHEAWFEKRFGGETGKALASEYDDKVLSKLDKMSELFAKVDEKGRTDIKVFKIKDADDNDATGAQKTAIKAMKDPFTLYTVKFVEPGKDSGLSVWSFAHTKGQWRFLGKMKAAKK